MNGGYDYVMLQMLLSESQNRMMKMLERANRRLKKAMEELDDDEHLDNRDCPTRPTSPNLWKPL